MQWGNARSLCRLSKGAVRSSGGGGRNIASVDELCVMQEECVIIEESPGLFVHAERRRRVSCLVLVELAWLAPHAMLLSLGEYSLCSCVALRHVLCSPLLLGDAILAGPERKRTHVGGEDVGPHERLAWTDWLLLILQYKSLAEHHAP